jgi:hypothetical protein
MHSVGGHTDNVYHHQQFRASTRDWQELTLNYSLTDAL